MISSYPGRCPSRVGFITQNQFADSDTASLSSISSSSSDLLPTIPEKTCHELSPPPKRKPTEDFDDVWFRCHLAEVIELDMFDKGCPYFRRHGAGQCCQAVLRDIAYYVNVDDEQQDGRR